MLAKLKDGAAAAAGKGSNAADMYGREGSDEELDKFMEAEAEAEEKQREGRTTMEKMKKKIKNMTKKKKKPDAKEEEKLFMQLPFTEQKKIGTKAPVLREVEGDSMKQRVKSYRRSVFFHIHASMDHKAYVLNQLRLAKQDPNTKDERGRTALHYACRYGAESVVKTLLNEDATIDDPDLEMRWTPLHFAVMGNHPNIVERLINKAPVRRITINRKDKFGTTPLMLACGEDYADVVKVLLQKKAYIDETDEDGWTALHYAAVNDSAVVGEMLIRFDANLFARTTTTNETALEMAERVKSHFIAILLYEFMYRA